MTVRLGPFGPTVTKSVTATSSTFAVDASIAEKKFAFYLCSDQPCHVHRTTDEDSATDATTSDARLPAGTPVLVDCLAGDFLTFIAGADATADGTIWITSTDHT